MEIAYVRRTIIAGSFTAALSRRKNLLGGEGVQIAGTLATRDERNTEWQRRGKLCASSTEAKQSIPLARTIYSGRVASDQSKQPDDQGPMVRGGYIEMNRNVYEATCNSATQHIFLGRREGRRMAMSLFLVNGNAQNGCSRRARSADGPV
jgi:hypothetical protein